MAADTALAATHAAAACGNCSGSSTVSPTTSYTYAGDGQVQTMTAPDGEETCYSYDSSGDLTSVAVDCAKASNLNLTTQLNYDETPPGGSAPPRIGNVTSIVTPAGHRYAASYDVARRMVSRTNPPTPWLAGAPSLSTTYAYDADGRLKQTSTDTGTTGANGEIYQVATLGYDNIGNPKYKTVPTTGTGTLTTGYTYDGDERLSTTVDPAGNTTTQTYDGDSRPTQTFLAGESSAAKTITYNGDGLATLIQDGRGGTTIYAYDPFDRLTATDYQDGTSEALTLDNDGGVTKRVDRSGNTSLYSLDALERETSETDTPAAQGQGTYTKSFTYDAASRIFTVGGSDGSFRYGYDTAGRQTLTVYAGPQGGSNGGYTVGYTYDADNNTRTITYPDGYVITYNYDALEEMLSVAEAPMGGSNTTLVTYSYNTLGDLTLAQYGNGASVAYSAYDQYNHLTQLQHNVVSGNGLTIGYSLDKDERRIQDSFSDARYVWHPPAASSNSYAADALNKYYTINGQSLEYSSNGALTADPTAPLGSASYGWDMFNRLTGVTNSQHAASYAYDPKGNRSQKTVDGAVQFFAYDAGRTIMQYGTGAMPASAQFHFVYGVGNAPFMQEGVTSGAINNRLYYHADALGSTLAMSGSSGNLNGPGPVTSPWGETANGSGTPYRFAGMWLDGESLLYYDHARYYSPAQGRFISPDPIGIEGGINIYAYAGSDPVNKRDLRGLDINDCDLCNDGGDGGSDGGSGGGDGGSGGGDGGSGGGDGGSGGDSGSGGGDGSSGGDGGSGGGDGGSGGGGSDGGNSSGGHYEYSTIGGTTAYDPDGTEEVLSQSVRTWVPDWQPSSVAGVDTGGVSDPGSGISGGIGITGGFGMPGGGGPSGGLYPRFVEWGQCTFNSCLPKLDPLSGIGKGLVTGLGGTFPKALIGQPSGTLGYPSRITTIPSAIGHALGGGGVNTWPGGLRTIGRGFSPLWIGYGVYMFGAETYCGIICGR